KNAQEKISTTSLSPVFLARITFELEDWRRLAAPRRMQCLSGGSELELAVHRHAGDFPGLAAPHHPARDDQQQRWHLDFRRLFRLHTAVVNVGCHIE
ncbi:MAG: hypothetical protein ACXVH7_04890, partial [Thermoanaerobaculia bacterium]